MSLKRVTQSAADPTGRYVAYVLSVPRDAEDEPGGSYSQIWVSSINGGETRRFTPEKVNSTSPQWSPDGKTIAFLSMRKGQNEHTQIYLLPVNGGEARMLTEHETSISSFQWSPDGQSIAYASQEAKADDQKEAEKEGRDWVITDQEQRYQRLWVIDVETGEGHVVYDDNLSASSYVWSPDSRTLVFQAADTTSIDDGMMYQRIYTVTATGGEPGVLCSSQGKLGSMAVSPDGNMLAFQGATSLNDPLAHSLFVVPLDGSEPRNLTEDMEASVAQVAWLAPRTIVMLTQDGTKTNLSLVDAVSGRRSAMTIGDVVIQHFDLVRDTVHFVAIGSDSHHSDEIYVGDPVSRFNRLTNHNPILDTLRLARQETIEWTGAEGWTIQGVLTWPVDYVSGTRYPLVVNPHGGPEGVSQESFNVLPQLLAANGYVVLQPNYRGSGGRGVAFSKGDHNDLGGTEFQDILAGIDELVNRGIVDAERVGMGGWSYGGFLSAFAATHYSHRFKAAVMGAGISNWISFAGTTDIPHEMQIVHWNQWWQDDPNIQWMRSPLSAIANANTPTLILHGAEDVRVHPEQGMQMYQALKHRGIDTELVMYPRAPHGPEERAHLLDIYQRHLEWFDRYLKGE